MTGEERRGLEDLVRLRFGLGPPDPAILATSQLVDAGMGRAEAIDVVVPDREGGERVVRSVTAAPRRQRQVVRVLAILQMLLAGRRATVQDLARRFKTRRQTIYQDLRVLEDVGYPPDPGAPNELALPNGHAGLGARILGDVWVRPKGLAAAAVIAGRRLTH